MNRIIGLIAQKIGIDKSIAYSSGSRIINAFAGILTILLIANFFSGEEQGLYYTFGSIVALQVFFELGLTGILTQFVAHENAHIEWENDKISGGDKKHLSRLSHLVLFTQKWYLVISIAFLAVILTGGFYFFYRYANGIPVSEWLLPWILVTTATAANLFLAPFYSILSGVGKIKETSKISFYQQIIMPIAVGTTIFCGGNLYAIGIGYWCSFITGIVIIRFSILWKIIKEIRQQPITDRVSYKNEIFPFQWKIALSWASGYFVFQLFNPVLYATSGAVVAGQMGMTLSAINGVASLSASWISTKVPLFSKLIALKDYLHLDLIFKKTTIQLGLICTTMLVVFWLVIYVLKYFQIPLGSRFIGLLPLAFMEIAILANQYSNCWAVYLRCHKQEPLLVNSLVGAITCGISTIVLAKYTGVVGMTLGYCIIRIAIMYWTYIVYKNKRKKWHIFNSDNLSITT